MTSILITISIIPTSGHHEGQVQFVELENADLHNYALAKFNDQQHRLNTHYEAVDGDCELMRIEFPDFIPL